MKTTPDDPCFLFEILKKYLPEDPGGPSDDEQFRRALFSPMELKSGERMPALDVFFASLTTASAQKADVHANRALRRISEYRAETKPRARAAVEADERLGGPRWRRFQEFGNLLAGLVYLTQLPSIQQTYQERYGPLTSMKAPELYYIDPAPAASVLAKSTQRQQRKCYEGDYEVGYCKPPTKSRFTSENNPAQKRKGQTASPWEELERCLTKPVFKTKSNGERIRSTTAAISYDQLIIKAIKGDRAARTEVVRRIIDLDRKGMLAAPAPVRRAKRKPPNPEVEAKLQKLIALVTLKIRDDMIANVERRYGKPLALEDYEFRAATNAAESGLEPASPTRGSGEDIRTESDDQ